MTDTTTPAPSPEELARRKRDLDSLASTVADSKRNRRDYYSARNAPALIAALQAARSSLLVIEATLGAMATDADFSAAQHAAVEAIAAASAAISALAPQGA